MVQGGKYAWKNPLIFPIKLILRFLSWYINLATKLNETKQIRSSRDNNQVN